ncbi:MAG: hypothetical protein V5B32_10475 [Candidatus Accumulibacter sp. UW26]|jgi:hypothetical protein
MRTLVAAVLFFLVGLGHVGAATFSLPEAGVSFQAPDGFTKLSAQEIAIKYPASPAPSFVVGDHRRTTSIAFDLKPNALPADRLPEAKAAFESFFDRRIPRVEWKQKKLIELQGQQWIYLEMTSRAVDTDIHNIMLVTPRYGKMLMFNFNSTREEFPHMETALRKSIQSISLRNRP